MVAAAGMLQSRGILVKGVVFVELLKLADARVGEEVVDSVVAKCPLSSGGAYTAVGTYPASELDTLVGALSDATGTSVDALQRQFGHWMLRRFVATYPSFFESRSDAFDMLESIETEVHVEVRKLYPDSELPTFETERLEGDVLKMTYKSPRRMIAFCHGLIEACLEHYNESADIGRTEMSTAGMGIAEFVIRRKAA